VSDTEVITDRERIEAIGRYELIASTAALLPVHDCRDGGRPRHYSPFVMLLVHVIAKNVYKGRVRKTIGELKQKLTWDHLAGVVRAAYPSSPDLWLPPKPPRRHHYLHFAKTYLRNRDGTEILSTALIDSGVNLALELSLCDGTDGGSFAHPALTACIEGDGKVISAITKLRPGQSRVDQVTGEIRQRRCDPDVGRFRVGGKQHPVRGHRHVTMSTRGPGWYQRAILGIASAPTGSEIDSLLPMVEKVHDRLQVTGLIYDGAFRGKHAADVVRQFGIVPIFPAQAHAVEKTDRTKRTEREVLIGLVELRYGDGRTRSMNLWTYAGAPCELVYNEAGGKLFKPLRLVRRLRRGKPGSFRFYGEFATDDGGHLRIPEYQTDDDTRRRFNRLENLRHIPPGSNDYESLYGRRADTESMNRQLEDACWQKRANCYGREAVYADVLGWALGENAVARYLHRLRSSNAPPGEQTA
jgi:hypothetical protein